MDLLFYGIIIGFICGTLFGASIYALLNIKKKADMQKEIDNLKKEVAFNKKMRQSVD